jgi:hypothetical protein
MQNYGFAHRMQKAEQKGGFLRKITKLLHMLFHYFDGHFQNFLMIEGQFR